ncbi:uncharacterized protein LOC132201868 [Neocloeon triangulifer]|uniref:uncharacterized protein LOC132201868 n=1 Tax=Neocloeon triangulifer TaxID=2078957 RepID=UPI00286F2189|nr:uncharacterized protein LOC132201868 [Neocloeon triangulifer]
MITDSAAVVVIPQVCLAAAGGIQNFHEPSKYDEEISQLPLAVGLTILVVNTKEPSINVDYHAGSRELDPKLQELLEQGLPTCSWDLKNRTLNERLRQQGLDLLDLGIERESYFAEKFFHEPSKYVEEISQLPFCVALTLVVLNTKDPSKNVDYLAGYDSLIQTVRSVLAENRLGSVRNVDIEDNRGAVKLGFLDEVLQLHVQRGYATRLDLPVKYLLLALNGKNPRVNDRSRELDPKLQALLEQGLPPCSWAEKNRLLDEWLKEHGVIAIDLAIERRNLKRRWEEVQEAENKLLLERNVLKKTEPSTTS